MLYKYKNGLNISVIVLGWDLYNGF